MRGGARKHSFIVGLLSEWGRDKLPLKNNGRRIPPSVSSTNTAYSRPVRLFLFPGPYLND